jgi:bifunctional UDP-N-acetylglucosamine pyrophosphorylase / glucosamine-1-phosphate N-acetyltransferase
LAGKLICHTLFGEERKTMKTACVILAAGDGKRMHSSLPKVLHPVCDQPMIAYPVSLALERGFSPVVVVISKHGRAVEDYLTRRFGKRLRFAVQDPPRGTGHAVMAAKKSLGPLKGKLAIVYGDVPLLSGKDLSALDRAGRNSAVAFLTCRLDDPSGYGRVVRDDRGRVAAIVEHKDASPSQRRIDEINAGIYLVEGRFAFKALGAVKSTNAQKEFYLTDLIAAAKRSGLSVAAVERKTARALLGVNSREQLAAAEKEMNRRLAQKLMARGVSLIDPEHTYLGSDVKVGKDSLIFPGCFFSGRVRIGSNCRIGPGVVIKDAEIDKAVEIKAYSVLESCQVGRGAIVGPFARLRPGAKLEADARVGNFVEMKKSTLGKGSKANHLSYLGDAEIGAGVNVGAGTITCNYDGVNKYKTEIEDGVFIGSDTQLVAPVKVGRGAVVGAGTTVTTDVPADALAVSRVSQKNIKGYGKRLRRKKSSNESPKK